MSTAVCLTFVSKIHRRASAPPSTLPHLLAIDCLSTRFVPLTPHRPGTQAKVALDEQHTWDKLV
jgi:hypothetical protein